ILIQKGYARKFVKEGDKETNEVQMAIDAPAADDEENRAAMPTAFAITRLDDFFTSLRSRRGGTAETFYRPHG
ncbi:hypothetical protein A2U01_0107744, partial [Trifolium medium]|nr:hypothetical protein [Trifolium medium]